MGQGKTGGNAREAKEAEHDERGEQKAKEAEHDERDKIVTATSGSFAQPHSSYSWTAMGHEVDGRRDVEMRMWGCIFVSVKTVACSFLPVCT